MINTETEGSSGAAGLDFFSALMTDIKSLNDKKENAMVDILKDENKKVASYQGDNAEAFCNEIESEANFINERVLKLREKVSNHHSQGPGKSFLKAPLRVYETAIPTMDVEALQKTFTADVETCKSLAERMD